MCLYRWDCGGVCIGRTVGVFVGVSQTLYWWDCGCVSNSVLVGLWVCLKLCMGGIVGVYTYVWDGNRFRRICLCAKFTSNSVCISCHDCIHSPDQQCAKSCNG